MTTTVDDIEHDAAPGLDDEVVRVPTAEDLAEADADAARLTGDPIWAALTAPFEKRYVGMLPKPITREESRNGVKAKCQRGSGVSVDRRYCGGYHVKSIHLDYVGHAAIQDRLDAVVTQEGWGYRWADPDFDPAKFEALAKRSLPLAEKYLRNCPPKLDAHNGAHMVLEIMGEERTGYGHADGKTGGDLVKMVYSDALKNTAMRFGIARYLWLSRDVSDLQDDAVDERPKADAMEVRRAVFQALGEPETAAEVIRRFYSFDQERGVSWEGVFVPNEFGDKETLDAWTYRMARYAQIGTIIVDHWRTQAPAAAPQGPRQAPSRPQAAPAVIETRQQAPAPVEPSLPQITKADSWSDECRWQASVMQQPIEAFAKRPMQMMGVDTFDALPDETKAETARLMRTVVAGLLVGLPAALVRTYKTASGPVTIVAPEPLAA